MVYTITPPPINWTSLQESYLEFKLDMLKYEQSIFEMFADMEYNSILNESSLEVIHEGQFMDKVKEIVNHIVELIRKFINFLKEQWKKFKTFIIQKLFKWKQKVKEEESKAKESISEPEVKSDSRDKNPSNVEYVYMNKLGSFKVNSLFELLNEYITKLTNSVDCIEDYCLFYLYPGSDNRVEISDGAIKSLSELKDKFGSSNISADKIIKYMFDELSFENCNSLNEAIRKSITTKEYLPPYYISHLEIMRDSMDRWIPGFINDQSKLYNNTIKKCDKMEKNIKKLLSLKDVVYIDQQSKNISSKIIQALSEISKSTISILSVNTQLYNALIQETTYLVDQTNISYLKLIKANSNN